MMSKQLNNYQVIPRGNRSNAFSFWFLYNKDRTIGFKEAIVALTPQKIPGSKQNLILEPVVKFIAKVPI